MSIDALLKLRDDVAKAISTKAAEMQRQLSMLGNGTVSEKPRRGRPPKGAKAKKASKAKRGAHPLAGRKLAVKFRGPNGQKWSGRGMQPVWLREALKSGKMLQDFAV